MPDLPGVERRRDDYRWFLPITVRWGDVDIYGHVNNVVHHAWFDTAVNTWLREATGIDVRQLPEIGVVAETACRYLGELHFPGTVDVGLAVDRVGTSSVTYTLAIFAAGDDHPSATGRFVHVYVDAEQRRPVPVPPVIRASLG